MSHVSDVHALLSSGKSLSLFAAIVEPFPSHTSILQSPSFWVGNGVPFALKSLPHTPSVHVRVWHALSVPGQSSTARHSTHFPLPSHNVPLFEHGLPAAFAICSATPSTLHTSSVHSFISSTGMHIAPPEPPLPPIPPAPPVVSVGGSAQLNEPNTKLVSNAAPRCDLRDCMSDFLMCVGTLASSGTLRASRLPCSGRGRQENSNHFSTVCLAAVFREIPSVCGRLDRCARLCLHLALGFRPP